MGKRVPEPRVERFTLVLSGSERSMLETLAKRTGLTMSGFIRGRVFSATEEDFGSAGTLGADRQERARVRQA